VIGQCVPLSASTGHETGTDAVGTALTDDWEIDLIARSLARSLARSNERRRDFSTVDDARSIVLIYSRRESHLAFVYSCIRAFVYSFILIHSFIRTVDFHHHGGGFGQRGTGDADEGDRGGGVVESERGGAE
jgi:hypothetical protein